MNDISPKFILNLKTGFFKTAVYVLSLQQKSLCLIPSGKNKKDGTISINYSDIVSVNISDGMNVEIEIRTEKETYIGTFVKENDLVAIFEKLGKLLGKRISRV